MANTRDLIGDQATLDGLVSGTLTKLEEDGVSAITSHIFRENKGIETIILPNVTSIGQYAFNGCENLKTLDLSKSITSLGGNYMFVNCYRLTNLILRSSTMCTLSSGTILDNTLIGHGDGAIFVPVDMVSTYKANNYWKNYRIEPLTNYPITDFGTITDSWAEIFEAEDNNTYSSKYNIGDIKSITIDGEQYYVEIVGMDLDITSSGTDTAKITWLLRNGYTTHNMNSTATNTNGWAGSGMRTWLRNDVLPTIDSTVVNRIVEVTKSYYDSTSDSTLSSLDTIWIPSAQEIFGGTSYETSGIDYTEKFPNISSRIKYNTIWTTAQTWWLRSARSGTVNSFRYVAANGAVDASAATTARSVIFGFCT